MGLAELRARGHDPARLRAELLASLGVSADESDLRATARRFDPGRVPRTSPRWDVARAALEAS
jgi:hypothetical protein